MIKPDRVPFKIVYFCTGFIVCCAEENILHEAQVTVNLESVHYAGRQAA